MFLLAVAASLSGCFSDDDHARTTRENVSVNPARFCLAIEQRRNLGQHPPKLKYALRNADVDNFSGASEEQCNNRQFVYWALQPPLDADRLQLYVKVHFLEQRPDLATISPPPDGRLRLSDGRPAFLYRGAGSLAARFVIGSAVFDATLGCVPRDESIRLVPCRSPLLRSRALVPRLHQLLDDFEPQVRRYL
jgi:hypothetical protein